MKLLEKMLLIGGITVSSLFPMKSLGQSTPSNTFNESSAFYYGSTGISTTRLNNVLLDQSFGPIFSIKGGIGANTGGLSRIEIEGELYSKKNKEEGLEISGLNGALYYDLILKPTEKMMVYGGAGLKATSVTLQIDLSGNQIEQVKTSGIGYGVRLGIEGKLGKDSNIYLEAFYNDLSGTLDEKTTNLSGSGLTAGLRTKF